MNARALFSSAGRAWDGSERPRLCLALALLALTLSLFAHSVPAQVIKLGHTSAPSNSLVGAFSREYNAGIQMAVDRTNASGGVRGRSLALVSQDDGFDAKNTVALAEAMVEQQGIIALVGVVGTQPTVRLVENKILEKHRLALIGPLTGLQSALASPNVFPIRSSYEDEVRAMFDHSAQLSRNKVLFVYYEAGVGPSLAPLVSEMASEQRISLTGVIGFPVTADKAAQQSAIRRALAGSSANPDSVVLIAVGQAHSEAVKAIRHHFGVGMPIYSLGQVDASALVADVGLGFARGVMFSQVMPAPRSINLQIVREFNADRKRFAPQIDSTYAFLEGYICGRIAIEIVRSAKEITRESVLLAAEQAGQLDVGGYRVYYGRERRRSVNPIELTIVSRDGALAR
jgi:branched-chain amino acid transport system substrate-binding protein